ncbi:MAG TPA: hypothetical protein VFE08_04790 [Candidatus Sulfotelmatobacter sp.]|nr:hypothetical protein [Candidatus Sulfotelmatobacter sp.]
MSLHIVKLFSRPLALASAILVIPIGVATAADSTDYVQQQAQSGLRDGAVTSPTPDAQELARRLLLGTTGSRVRGAETRKYSEVAGATGEAKPQKRRLAYGDAQAAAQQLLLGQHHASDAPQSGLRDDAVTSPSPDAQELARQLLLGTTGSHVRGAQTTKHSEVAGATGETEPQRHWVAYGDAQAAAQ